MSLCAMPSVRMTDVRWGVEGEEGDVRQLDLVTVSARVVLTRLSHSEGGLCARTRPDSQGSFRCPGGGCHGGASPPGGAPRPMVTVMTSG
jgi:hypothetical protein